MSVGGSTKVIVISLLANCGIALAKFTGAFFTGSAALLAEAVHSLSDCGNQLLLLYGGHAARKGVSPEYPLGRDKELFFWSFVVALLLFSLGGLFSFYEGIHKILHPEPLSYPLIALGILLVAVCLEGFSFGACCKEVRATNTHGSLWQWVRRTSSADLLVIFLEDLAALLGLMLAFFALLAAWLTGDSLWDGIGSCAIGTLLISVAMVLAREVKPLLIGEKSGHDYRARVEALLPQHFAGGRVLKLIALQQGVRSVLLAYKIHPGDPALSVADAITRVNNLEKQVKTQYPEVLWQFAELDVKE